MKYIEGALYFYFGGLIIGLIAFATQSIKFKYGYAYLPEGGVGLLMLGLIPLSIVYYITFLVVHFGLSRLRKEVLAPSYFLPLSFITGLVVGLTFTNEEVDFLIWISYGRDSTTLLSTLAIEILALLVTFGIIWRTINSKAR
jgi:hypothetical protein